MKIFGVRVNIHHYFHWVCAQPKKAATRIVLCLRPDPAFLSHTQSTVATHSAFAQEITHMNLNVGQTKILDLVAKTASGAPARLDSVPAPEYTNANPAVCSIEVAPDGLSVAVTGLTPGDSAIGARADADLRPGMERFLDATPVSVTVAGAAEEEAATIELVERP